MMQWMPEVVLRVLRLRGPQSSTSERIESSGREMVATRYP